MKFSEIFGEIIRLIVKNMKKTVMTSMKGGFMMRKILLLVLILTLTVSIVSCASADNEETSELTTTENTTTEQKIKLIHDYIINNTKYDVQKTENTNSTLYKSEIAYGPLLQGYGICSGYTDAMQLMLERLEIENFKVASTNHVWNAVKIDDTWKHLDLTWDDPILDIGLDWIIHDFYLISTEELLKLDQTEHTFDQNIYVELKQVTQN